jgi:hypothetical protein
MYIWKIDNENFSEKLNPKWIWVEWIWKHEIIFQVWDIQEVFVINIVEKSLLEATNWKENSSAEDKIWAEKEEKIKFTQNFLVLKYDGLRISWLAPAWSKIEIYHKWERVLEWVSDEKWKYRLVSKNFIAWNYTFDTKVIFSSGEEVFLENSGEFDLLQEKRIYWFVSKKSSSSSSKSVASVKIPNLILQAAALDTYSKPGKEKLWMWMSIFLIIAISMIAIIGALHLIFIQTVSIPKNIFSIYKATFSTRQKVCLLIQ